MREKGEREIIMQVKIINIYLVAASGQQLQQLAQNATIVHSNDSCPVLL